VLPGSGAFWISGVCWSVMFTAFMLALTFTSVANVLIIMSVGPLFTALVARVHHRPAPAAAHLGWRSWPPGRASSTCTAASSCRPSPIRRLDTSNLVIGVADRAVRAGGGRHQLDGGAAQPDHGEKIDLVPSVLLGAVHLIAGHIAAGVPVCSHRHRHRLAGLLGLVQLAIPCALAWSVRRVLKAPEVSLLACWK
jgi:hypothetical protein